MIAREAWVALASVVLIGCSAAEPDREELGLETQRAAVGTLQSDKNRTGWVESFSSTAFERGETNGFFASLGTNGRTCNTCHLPNDGWSITPISVRARSRFDPIFAPVDGSDCPPTSAGQGPDAQKASALLDFGLFRVELGIPEGADFTLASATNPKRCATAPGAAANGGKLFLFRRPLPSTNLLFNSAVMWDGRLTPEPLTTTEDPATRAPLLASLFGQANEATVSHAQGTSIDETAAQADIVSFEMGLFTAQARNGLQGVSLTSDGAKGGASFIGDTVAPSFYIGKNDPLAPGFTNAAFDVYAAWEPTSETYASLQKSQRAIGRGEAIFNETTFVIRDVPGLNSMPGNPLYNPNDPLAGQEIVGGCGVCHNSPNIGNHTIALPINIGTTMAKPKNNDGSANTALGNAHLPVYTLKNGARTVAVTDPGRALVTGRFLDSGKVKGPNLRGLASRAPYFHNGAAADLKAVVRFYQARFSIDLTPAEIDDLVAFLEAL